MVDQQFVPSQVCQNSTDPVRRMSSQGCPNRGNSAKCQGNTMLFGRSGGHQVIAKAIT